MDATIRLAAPADAAGIGDVRVNAWRATYRGMIPDAYLDAMKVEDSAALWSKVLAAPTRPARSSPRARGG
jgi:hypothetical protein